MNTNDMILKMIFDLETKEALHKADNFANLLEKKMGLTFSKVKDQSGKLLKNLFVQDTSAGNSTTKVFKALVKDMNSLVEAIVRVDRETGKMKSYRTRTLTGDEIASRFGLDKSMYDGTALAQAQKEKEKQLLEELKARRQISQIIAQNEIREARENESLRRAQGRYEFDSALGLSKPKIEQIKETVRSLKNEISSLREEYSSAYYKGEDTTNILERSISAQKELTKAEKDLRKQTTKSSVEKLWNSFKRIGIYRIFRGIFASIKQGFQQGIQSLVLFDKEANKTISSLTSSFDKIKGSLAIIVMPLVESIQPIINDIALSFASIAEDISIASSMSKGMSTYTKLNSKYMKDYASSLKSLTTSFDKFESLNGSASMFEKGSIGNLSQEQIDRAKQTAQTISTFKESLSDIWDIVKNSLAPAIKGLLVAIQPYIPILFKALETIITIIAKTLVWIDENIGVENAFKAIGVAIIALMTIGFVGWLEKLSLTISYLKGSVIALKGVLAVGGFLAVFKIFDDLLSGLEGKDKLIYSIAIALVGLGAVAIGVWQALKGNTLGAGIAVVAGAGMFMAGLKGAISAGKDIKGYYTGGSPQKGDLFYANERGPELVYAGPNGRTQVNTSKQLKDAVVEAIYETSDILVSSQAPVILNVDGAEIARSKRLKEELNRTNSGLNLK